MKKAANIMKALVDARVIRKHTPRSSKLIPTNLSMPTAETCRPTVAAPRNSGICAVLAAIAIVLTFIPWSAKNGNRKNAMDEVAKTKRLNVRVSLQNATVRIASSLGH